MSQETDTDARAEARAAAIISPDKQKEICNLIKTMCTKDGGYDIDRQHILFIGVLIALERDEVPPFWQNCIYSHRTDRIMEEVLKDEVPR